MQDLKALEKLENGEGNGQLQGLTAQAAEDEKDRADEEQVQQGVEQINKEADAQV